MSFATNLIYLFKKQYLLYAIIKQQCKLSIEYNTMLLKMIVEMKLSL